GGNKGTDNTNVTPANLDRMCVGMMRDSSPSSPMSGSICESVFWDAALTDEDAVSLALGYSPKLVRPQNLVAYWKLIRDLNDGVGGYNLTASGTTVSAHSRMIYPARTHIGVPVVSVGWSQEIDPAINLEVLLTLSAKRAGEPSINLEILNIIGITRNIESSINLEASLVPKMGTIVEPNINLEVAITSKLKQAGEPSINLEASLLSKFRRILI
ncbi:unnamed protein product, partial [marine sediment metagenome]